MRAITNDDLWACIRGLRMARMTREELGELIARHKKLAGTMFASAVIVEAATQMAARWGRA